MNFGGDKPQQQSSNNNNNTNNNNQQNQKNQNNNNNNKKPTIPRSQILQQQSLQHYDEIPRKKILGLLQFLGPPVGCKEFKHVSELATLQGLDLNSGMSRIAFMPVWLHVPLDREWDAESVCKTGLKLPQGGVGNKAPLLEEHLCKIGRPDIVSLRLSMKL